MAPNPKWLVPLINNNRNCHLITKLWSMYYLIIGKYGDSSEFFAPLWKYATMADAYVEEIHFRETSQLLTKREISAITGIIFLFLYGKHQTTFKSVFSILILNP